MKINIKSSGSLHLIAPIYSNSEQFELESEWFEPSFWKRQQLIVGESKGRYTTWFVRPTEISVEGEWVLRHYYRGGLVAKISKDKFVFTGVQNTRPYKEISLLVEMGDLGLPVPVCIGARVIRRGLHYQADLLMQKIDATDLVGVLSTRSLSIALWKNIGKVIAQFHSQGIYHSDLNAHNIMLDKSGQIWLIDFDRCDRRKVEPRWQMQNLQRLKRSFEKELNINSKLHFSQQEWDSLMQGYQQS